MWRHPSVSIANSTLREPIDLLIKNRFGQKVDSALRLREIKNHAVAGALAVI